MESQVRTYKITAISRRLIPEMEVCFEMRNSDGIDVRVELQDLINNQVLMGALSANDRHTVEQYRLALEADQAKKKQAA